MYQASSHNPRILGLCALVAAFFIALPAMADRVVWKKTTIKESNESWRIDVEIHLSRAPDIAHIPMQFKFEPDVYYERTLLDGQEGPQLRKVPLENRQPLIETVDVGFLDPASGKIQSRTKFNFKLTRDRGFEAGEYKVSLRNKRTDQKLTPETRLVLDGENEVIDRRSMDFSSGGKKKKKKEEEAAPAEEEYDATKDPNSEEYWAQGPSEPEKDEEPLPPPAHMQKKPGACGCRVVGQTLPASSGWFLALGLVGLAFTRRRSR